LSATPESPSAETGYSKVEQAEACEARGIVPHVPVTRSVNNQGDGRLFDRSQFLYDEQTDTFRCPAGQTLTRKQLVRKDHSVYYAATADICGVCALKPHCTNGSKRIVSRHLHEDAFQRNAAASDTADDATATIDRGASLRFSQVPRLWTPAIPAARVRRSAD
jgi:hypothetical protein